MPAGQNDKKQRIQYKIKLVKNYNDPSSKKNTLYSTLAKPRNPAGGVQEERGEVHGHERPERLPPPKHHEGMPGEDFIHFEPFIQRKTGSHLTKLGMSCVTYLWFLDPQHLQCLYFLFVLSLLLKVTPAAWAPP